MYKSSKSKATYILLAML